MSGQRSRILINAVFLTGHVGNTISSLYLIRDGQEVLKDKRVVDTKSQLFIYLTIWNVLFQMVYLIANLTCGIQELYKIKDRRLIGPLKTIKQVFFDSIVAPTTIGIIYIFWPMFVYDRELLYPAFIDDALGARANYMMHGFILLVVVWEMRYMSSDERNRGLNLTYMTIMSASYSAVVLFNYARTGLFPYPVLYMLYGTIYFPMFFAVGILLLFVAYESQWPLRRLISKQARKKKQ